MKLSKRITKLQWQQKCSAAKKLSQHYDGKLSIKKAFQVMLALDRGRTR